VLDALQHVREQRHPGADRPVVVAVHAVVLLVPARPETEDQPAPADVVDSAGHVSEQIRIPIADPGHQRADLHPRGHLGSCPQRRPGLEVVHVGLLRQQNRPLASQVRERLVEMV
jgi:hypothetical protein